MKGRETRSQAAARRRGGGATSTPIFPRMERTVLGALEEEIIGEPSEMTKESLHSFEGDQAYVEPDIAEPEAQDRTEGGLAGTGSLVEQGCETIPNPEFNPIGVSTDLRDRLKSAQDNLEMMREAHNAVELSRNNMNMIADIIRERWGNIVDPSRLENGRDLDDDLNHEHSKGKEVDPRNWGAAGIPEEELDRDFQQHLQQQVQFRDSNDSEEYMSKYVMRCRLLRLERFSTHEK
ncbi:hypothetical protein AGABI2DRAFT_119907 [Agaricus bisporus var. bisporus H97]|uniref:hypothetical protein n=1 Tax=Agaricus bisporus var. bisporus (strain H97 / ATCC MYA-4626 / FGSC 10389) TaxID=936046 RepID=UPI00029F5EDB|nr:hypothetical protein AGABI2DRAFT_119907 [Agaricus bisporus var. bisporus H97]EKV44937.1 hypothetical protein AGABI2DRAFT_119907 [Agaricus bisporus var. bisporus H97]